MHVANYYVMICIKHEEQVDRFRIYVHS